MSVNGKAKKLIEKLHIKFQISLLLIIFIILVISTSSTIYAVLAISRNVSTHKAEQLFNKTGESIKLKLDSQIDKVIQLAGLMTTLSEFSETIEGDGTSYSGLPFLIEALKRNSYFYSIYSGFRSGYFLQLIRTSSNPVVLDAHGAPEQTIYILRTITGTGKDRLEQWTFLDSELDQISTRGNQFPDYMPSDRPWFSMAMKSLGEVILTEPYIYNSLKQPGITAAAAMSEDAVIGIDITLADLKSFLDSMDVSPNAGIMILDEQGRILTYNSAMGRWLGITGESLLAFSELNPEKTAEMYSSNHLLWDNPWVTSGGQNYRLIITAPVSDFMKHQENIQRRIVIISIVIFLLVIPLVILISRYMSIFLEHLSEDAERIQNFIFDGEVVEHSPIIEFEELAGAFRVMKSALAVKTKELENTLKKLERIIELGIAMSVEKNPDKLVEMILKGAKELSGADGGSLYLKGEKDELDFKIVLNDSLGIAQGGTSPNKVTLPPVSLYEADGSPNYHNVVSCAFHKGETIIIDDAYQDPQFDFSGTKKFDDMNNYRSQSFMTVPLKLQGSEIIGAFQLINCTSVEDNIVVPFSRNIQGFIEALGSLAAAILYNRNLMDAQDVLFESLIQLIASAIDAKSPYTGGHCERVPELAIMLAEEAEKVSSGPFADFRFESAEEKRAFIIGSWLHDAGKMTTPEFVVDKAAKLETIYNRIHEIRTRFEVLLRDAKLEEKEALLEGKNPAAAAAAFEAAEKELFDDFEFIAGCNTGEQEMTDADRDRLYRISKKSWRSNFDHTIGLSREEQERTTVPYRKGEPFDEYLISDKPQHMIPDSGKTKDKYKGYDFIIPRPDILYNRGEIHNLLIPQGTLTEEERFKINEHIMQTIVMLSSLPLPKGMSRIPEFGGTHHENLLGTGYPRGLKGSELSIPSRIMTIADIFEALTASDRPYKKANKLSEAVEILNQLSLTGHIDRNLFVLFLTSGIYLKYAKKFLPPKQIDEVFIEGYLDSDDL